MIPRHIARTAFFALLARYAPWLWPYAPRGSTVTVESVAVRAGVE